ncbi:MAG: anti-sigma factor [Planctomycetes bacterium]|nr:anti-sigma factor [Planctomycetota bacterium]
MQELRAALAAPSLYHRPPDAVRARLRSALESASRGASAPAPAPRSRPKGRARAVLIATAAAAVLVVVSLAAGALLFRSAAAEDRLAEEVVAGHVRSLQVAHATDVASSDRHTVKPWFRGKLDFAPQVPDLSAAGFALTGGRLDYLGNRPVAALVYHRRAHPINVFTWPAGDGAGEGPIRALHRQGFHIRAWRQSEMAYWAVSDLNTQELDEFVRLFRTCSSAPSP